MDKQRSPSVSTAGRETPMDDPLHHRDYLARHALAFGEQIAPEQLPENLAWRAWQPVTQRLYLWAWAVHGAHLYSCLDDVYGRGGLWRLPLRHELQRRWRAIQHRLGPLEPVVAVVLLAGQSADLALS
jgi:hypothetical protein